MTSRKVLDSVLFIDDDELELKLHQRVCERTGLVRNCETLLDVEEAMDRLMARPMQPHDVIFIDFNMPKMTGVEFLKLLEERDGRKFSKANFVMLTSSMDEAVREDASNCNLVTDFIHKPLSEETLFAIAQRFGRPEARPVEPAE